MSTNIHTPDDPDGDRHMPRVKVRRAAQLTPPDQARRKLGVTEGDDLEIELVEGGVLLKPVAAIDRDRAWADIIEAMAGVRPAPEQAGKPIERPEREIAEEIEAARREGRAKGSP